MRALGKTADRRPDYAEPKLCTIDEFPDAMTAMLEEHRPSRMPFFERLAAMPRSAASDPSFLGQIHLIYQSAMHATRAAVYYLPHLDSPALRKRKLQILVDDDGLPGGDTHHYQLTRAFRNIGAKCVLEDEEFGDPAVAVPPPRWRNSAFCSSRAPALRTLARALVRGRDNVGRLDASTCRGPLGSFPAVQARTIFRGVLFAYGRGASRRGGPRGDAIGPQSAAGAAGSDIARCQDHRAGARRGLEPIGQDYAARRCDAQGPTRRAPQKWIG